MVTLTLSDAELQNAAQGCRVAAVRAENDAASQTSPTIRESFMRTAHTFAALAARFEAARKPGNGG